MRMKMTRVRKTLARGGLQACEVPGGSNSSTRPWRTHVRLSNRVTSVSFCESCRGKGCLRLGNTRDEGKAPLAGQGLLALGGMHPRGKHTPLFCLGLPVQP